VSKEGHAGYQKDGMTGGGEEQTTVRRTYRDYAALSYMYK